MITAGKIKSLIEKHSEKPYSYGNERTISDAKIDKISQLLESEIEKSEEEWDKLIKLKSENAILKAENEIYRGFLLSANYKLPKVNKKAKAGSDE